jgi:predicted phosphodiesterase
MRPRPWKNWLNESSTGWDTRLVRYLVLSDIHANIDALDAVLDAADPAALDGVIILGDLVGYGAEPNRVVDRVRALSPVAIIRGNHDKVAAGLESAEGFNPTARQSAAWTRNTVTEGTRAYLAALERGPRVLDDLVEICHGSPVDEDTYIFGELDAAEALSAARRPVCLFGHTHLPAAAARGADHVLEMLFRGPRDEQRVTFTDDRRYLINPGSVGQPRDGDPRAAYAVLDTGLREIVIRRVAYPKERARDRILAAGLPKPLGTRLMHGR